MALSEQQKQELHTQYASKTDEALTLVPKHGNKSGTTSSPLYPLTELCATMYCIIFEVALWLIVLAGTIAGGVIGHSFAHLSDKGVGLVIGAIIGFFASFLIMLNVGGLLSVFLKLCQDVAKIAKGKS